MNKDVDRKKVVELYRSGKSTVEIGNEVGLTPGAVQSILRIRGVKTRSVKQSLKKKYPNGRFGEQASRWKGGRRYTAKGYIQIYSMGHPYADSAGYVMEHRLIVEKQLGKYLEKEYDVHHIDGDNRNNDPSNLLVLTRKEHARIHFDAVKEAAALKKEVSELKEQIKQLQSKLN
jgi:hypothetical protein